VAEDLTRSVRDSSTGAVDSHLGTDAEGTRQLLFESTAYCKKHGEAAETRWAVARALANIANLDRATHNAKTRICKLERGSA
jgi:hypothetical protein